MDRVGPRCGPSARWSMPAAVGAGRRSACRRRPQIARAMWANPETRPGARLLHRTTRRPSLTETANASTPAAKPAPGSGLEAEARAAFAQRRGTRAVAHQRPGHLSASIIRAPWGAFRDLHPVRFRGDAGGPYRRSRRGRLSISRSGTPVLLQFHLVCRRSPGYAHRAVRPRPLIWQPMVPPRWPGRPRQPHGHRLQLLVREATSGSSTDRTGA